jgi:hypothetical protein
VPVFLKNEEKKNSRNQSALSLHNILERSITKLMPIKSSAESINEKTRSRTA